MDAIHIIALTMGVGWASGLNLYAAILVLGLMGLHGGITLPDELQVLMHPAVLSAAGAMFVIEFCTDKLPGIDNGWDAIHTFIRIPAGAILAAGAVGDVSAPLQLSAALVGGALAAGSHATKAGGRIAINASPEPVSNWVASFTEDFLVIGGLWAALYYPWMFLGFLALFILFAAWMMPKIWSGIKRLFSFLNRSFGGPSAAPAD